MPLSAATALSPQPEGGGSAENIHLKSWPEIIQQLGSHPETEYYGALKKYTFRVFLWP